MEFWFLPPLNRFVRGKKNPESDQIAKARRAVVAYVGTVRSAMDARLRCIQYYQLFLLPVQLLDSIPIKMTG